MGSLQQICLRWNNHQINFPKVFDLLLQNSDLVDVTLSCEGQKLKAHKVVLSACSPYFHSLFQDNPCKHPIIVFRDIKYNELNSIIEFMYKGEVNVPRDELSDFIRTAQALQVKGIAEDSSDEGRIEPNSSRLKSTPNNSKKKSPPLLMPARKLSPSIPHSNNLNHPSKKPRLKEPNSGFRESPNSMFREMSGSSYRESLSPYRESPNSISFRESMNSLLKENSNHQVPTPQINSISNCQDNEGPDSPANVSASEAQSQVKLEMQDYDAKNMQSRHGIDMLMESTMETSDEQYVVGEGPPPDDDYSHDQSDDGSLPQYDDSSYMDTCPSTSFSEGHTRKQAKPRKSEFLDEPCTPLVEDASAEPALRTSKGPDRLRTCPDYGSLEIRNSKRPDRYKLWTEQQMTEAVNVILNDGQPVRPTSRTFGIPYRTLWNRVKKEHSLRTSFMDDQIKLENSNT